jgi:hypothetical protein
MASRRLCRRPGLRAPITFGALRGVRRLVSPATAGRNARDTDQAHHGSRNTATPPPFPHADESNPKPDAAGQEPLNLWTTPTTPHPSQQHLLPHDCRTSRG